MNERRSGDTVSDRIGSSERPLRHFVLPFILGVGLWMRLSNFADAAERTWVLLAGQPGTSPRGDPGSVALDGVGITAQFNKPGNIALDGAGNLYVLDQCDTVVRKVAPNGSVTTLAKLPDVKFDIDVEQRAGIAVDKGGDVYVSEPGRDRIVKISPKGSVSGYAGSQVGRRDGPASSALFAGPLGLALDKAGNLYVADSGNSAIRRITPEGVVTTVAGGPRGLVDGPIGKARFDTPESLAIDKEGNIYVAEFPEVDDEGHEGRTDDASTLRRIGVDGKVTTLHENAYSPGRENRVAPASTWVNWPDIEADTSIALDSQGLLYMISGGLRRVDPSKHDYYSDSHSDLGIQDVPEIARGKTVGIAIDDQGDVYVSDSDANAIFKAARP